MEAHVPIARWRSDNLDFDCADAVQKCCAALESSPDEVNLLLHLGKCQIERDLAGARWCFERVLALDPSHPIAVEALQNLDARLISFASPVFFGVSASLTCAASRWTRDWLGDNSPNLSAEHRLGAFRRMKRLAETVPGAPVRGKGFDTTPAHSSAKVSKPTPSKQTSARLSVALFNDTGCLSHAGCRGVSSGHDAMSESLGVDIAYRSCLGEWSELWSGERAASLQAFRKSQLPRLLHGMDAVVVNGEGTIHHGAGLHLTTILAGAQELGLPTFLVNAVFQECEQDLETLRKLDDFTVRDSNSAAYLERLGIAHRLVSDSILAADFENRPCHDFAGKIVVTDHHLARNHDVGQALKRLLKELGDQAVYYPLDAPERAEDWRHAVADLEAVRLVVTGRHHGVYLAGMAGVPFVALGSNTWKVEGLLAGLPGELSVCADLGELRQACERAMANRPLFKEVQQFFQSQLPLTTFERLAKLERRRPASENTTTSRSLDRQQEFSAEAKNKTARKIWLLCSNSNHVKLLAPVARQLHTHGWKPTFVSLDNYYGQGSAQALSDMGLERLELPTNHPDQDWYEHTSEQRQAWGAEAAKAVHHLFETGAPQVLVVGNDTGALELLFVRAAERFGTRTVLLQEGALRSPSVNTETGERTTAIGEVVGRDPLMAVHAFYKAPGDLPDANQRRVYQALTAACLLVRKSAFQEVGGFDEGFWNDYEDVDLCLRFQERGWLTVYEPASVVIHHESQSGPARFQKVQENIRRLHEKWLGKARLDVVVAADGAATQAATTRNRPYETSSAGATDTSILILTYNQLAHTKACLESIARHTPEPHELILVDNGSTDGTREYLREYARQHERVSVIANRTNLGFAAGNNQGLTLATGRQVLLLNNDTVVTPGWLRNMLKVLRDHPQTGVVGPRSNRVLGRQQVDAVGYKSLDELPAFAVGWSEKHAGESRVANRVVGCCLLARREVMDAVGGLDEQFGSGNFEDDDFCIRAHLAGFETRIADDSFVHHVGHATFNGAGIDYAKAMQTNWDLFKRKWAIPPETPPFPGYLTPDVAPPGVALKVPLPELKLTHQLSTDGRCWMDKLMSAAVAQPKPILVPPCASVGNLAEAREFLRQKKFPAAWGATRAALKHRPFHPEACLLLAEIAQAAHDPGAARNCAQFARQIAPEFRAAKKFLKGKFYGHAKHDWLVLPDEIGKPKIERRRHLSVCLIVKNEEQFLGQCLKSVNGLAAQIVVVDTGSTDRTVEIAKEHGAQVHAFAWCDDFSAARNVALEHATGDWILMLDADEELPPENQAALRKLLRTDSVMAWRLPIIDAGREDEGCCYVPRLFRNAPALFYVGRVHEQVFRSLEARRQEWGLENRLGDAALRHHGYRPDVVKDRNKIERNLRLLEQAVAESPDEPNLLMNHGLELTRSGRLDAGIEQYHKAFEMMSRQPAALVVPELLEMLLTQMSTHLMAQKRFDELVRVLTSPLAKAEGLTASLHFSLGLAHFELKQFREAAGQMRQCLAKRGQPALAPINREIRKAGPRHCLALCLDQLGEPAAAAEEFRRALEEDPHSRPVRFDYARFQAAQERPIEALNLFFALAKEQPGEAQVWLQGGKVALTAPEFLEVALDWTAEALRHLPDDAAVVQQRAEALLLAGQCAAALPLWRRLQPSPNPAPAAALVICETVAGENEFSPAPDVELPVSREFVNWKEKSARWLNRTPGHRWRSFSSCDSARSRRKRKCCLSGSSPWRPPPSSTKSRNGGSVELRRTNQPSRLRAA
jgi:GT2 family glycosyltransferase/tetratricopeptide (TPR) repeat protein